jgi:hypothetical protein
VRYFGADLRRTGEIVSQPCLPAAGDPAQNLTLQPQDIVRVFAKADFVDPPRYTFLA